MRPHKSAAFTAVTLMLLLSSMLLGIYAALCFSRANAELLSVEQFAQSVTDYYDADSQATQVMSRLMAASDLDTELSSLRNQGYNIEKSVGTESAMIHYFIPIDSERALEVKVQITGADWDIITWKLQ